MTFGEKKSVYIVPFARPSHITPSPTSKCICQIAYIYIHLIYSFRCIICIGIDGILDRRHSVLYVYIIHSVSFITVKYPFNRG